MAYLIDSNLLIYPFDDRDSAKQRKAKQVLDLLERQGTGVLPSQSLSEFANVMLRKLKVPASEVYVLVDKYEQSYSVLPLRANIVLEAVRGVRDHHFAYYDSQIWATAKLNQISVVLSEDFATASTVEAVTFLNPLVSDFDFDLLSGLT